MKPLVLIALLVLVPSLTAAELTPAEKAEVQKLYKANVLITGVWNDLHAAGDPGNSYRFATSKSALAKATGWLLHTHASVLSYEQVAYPEFYGGPIVGSDKTIDRAGAISRAFSNLDTVLTDFKVKVLNPVAASGPQSAFNKAQQAWDLVNSFDRSLPYENPLLPQFPLQFGPHGDYPRAQRALGEARRLLGYSGAYLAFYKLDVKDETGKVLYVIYHPTESENLDAYRQWARNWGESIDIVHRIMMLSGRVPALASDAALLDDRVGLPMAEIKQAALLVPPKFAAARKALDSMIPSAHISRRDASNSILGGWVQTDLWLWEFLEIK